MKRYSVRTKNGTLETSEVTQLNPHMQQKELQHADVFYEVNQGPDGRDIYNVLKCRMGPVGITSYDSIEKIIACLQKMHNDKLGV